MKNRLYRKIAMFMAFVLVVPMLWSMNVAVVQAATPSFVQTKVEIVGTGKTFQLEIQNKVDKSTYLWSTSDAGVATVTDTGLVTSVGQGTATIKCKITYPSKKTKSITCKVTVTIPADKITISNATLKSGAQVLSLYQTYDFECTMNPVNSTDKVYWSIAGGDSECIRIDDAVAGKVTAIKAGKVILKATAAKSATAEAAAISSVSDVVIIEVAGVTATVSNVDMTSSNTITAVFDTPVMASTVIGANNVLSDNITVSLCKDTKSVYATDPGKLTGSLSADGKTLTITAANSFSGYYGVNFSSSILTGSGLAIQSYYKKLYYYDTTPPAYAATTVDDTGYIATINFTEPLNFTNLKISGASVISTNGTTASSTTLAILNNPLNYTISADKRSMTINLKSIAPTDYGKMFQVYISGITDLAGNYPANMYLAPILQTDTSYKPQAQLLYITRTGYKTITATFDKAIQVGGILQIAGGSSIPGVVDTTDTKKVNFTISDAEALYTGSKIVTVGYWSSFNVNPADTTASVPLTRSVDFTIDSTSPVLTNIEYDTTKAILTLTYNKNVILAASSGVFIATYTSSSDDIRPNTNITYTNITHTDGNNIVKLQLSGVTTVGTYTFNLDPGFVTDNYNNKCTARAVVLTNSTGTSTELPAPVSIAQSPTNLSQINVRFLNKLDVTSAQTASNYTIGGLQVLTATVTENTSTGSNVVLTVADGTIVTEFDRPVTIKGVAGYNNSYSPITNYNTSITLKENVKPTTVGTGITYDTSAKNIVKLNFNEAIKGTITVKVSNIIGSSTVEIPNTIAVSGNNVIITLASVPLSGSWLRIDVLTNTLTDTNGNTASTLQSSFMTSVAY